MLGSDIARGAVVLLVSYLAFTIQLEIWEVIAASLFFGFVNAFFQPAFTALVPQLVPDQDLPSANSLSSLSNNLGRVLGPALGAGTVAAIGAPLAFLMNGLSFFASAILLLPLLRMSIPHTPAIKGVSFFREMGDGFRTVLASQWLWISILIFSITNVTSAGPSGVSLPFLVSDNLGGNIETLGIIYVAAPIGFITAGVFLGRYTRIRRRGILFYGSTLISALVLVFFGLLPPLWALVVAAFINGAALETGHMAWITSLQELVPNDKLGRVVSIDNMGSFALLPIGYALAGWATETYGAPIVFLVGGTTTALMMIIGLLIPAIRNLD
jgi:MFS family permease